MSKIKAGTTSTTAYQVEADTTGTLVLQTGASPTTAVTIGSDQTVTTAGTINGLTVGKGAGSVATNTAVGASALAANTTGNENVAIGYIAMAANTTGADNVGIGRAAFNANTTGNNAVAVGVNAMVNNTTGSNNVAVGMQALSSNTTASNNTAVGYQAGYSNTTGANQTFIGYQAGYSMVSNTVSTFVGRIAGYSTTGDANTFIGDTAGQYVTTGAKNTILGRYNGNQGGLDISTASNNIVLSDGDGNPRLNFVYSSSTIGRFAIYSNTSGDSTNATFIVQNASGSDIICEAGNYSPVGISGVIRLGKTTTNGRSINAGGTVNQNGADYAEYMVKSGDFTVAKGDVIGINADGKLTNVFADAVSFCVKSTDPGLVGGDSWFTEPRPQDENGNEVVTDTSEYAEWFARMEAARATVDRIAFCGQVPVNVTGATAGQFIVPTNDNGAIIGVAVNEADVTLSQYMKAVGKVIAIEQDGRAKIIVKVA